jgi:hypothetical protein
MSKTPGQHDGRLHGLLYLVVRIRRPLVQAYSYVCQAGRQERRPQPDHYAWDDVLRTAPPADP